MRITVGDITLEGANLGELASLQEMISSLREVAKTATPSVAKVPAYALKTDGRIRRTQDELSRGLSPEQALAERQLNGGHAQVSDEDKGASFQSSDELDLDTPPLD